MSNYWKKKLEELEQSNSPSKSTKKETTKSATKSDYWGSKLTELEKAEDIAPVAKPKVETTTTKIVGVKSDKEEKGSFWDWLGNSAMSGLASFNKGFTGTADLLLGKPLQALGWENNPISEAAEYYSDEYDIYKNKATTLAKQLGGDKNIAGMGNGYQIAGELLEGTVAAAPMAIEALMTGGGSLTDDLATAFTYRSGNLFQKAGITVEKMMEKPAFWTSFAQTYGNDYEEAVEKGADENVALYTSMLSSLINAGIEIGVDGASGIQGLPKKALDGDKSALMEWVKSSLEEGGEEILQGVVTRGINKVAHGTDEKVFDGEQMLKEGLMGTAVGGLLGGGQIGVQSSVNAVQQAQANKLTADEQAVVDKVVETRITEEELAGKPVTASEKRAIEKQVREELEKGRISIDTIEEVLGGDAYKTYKDAVDSEDKQIWELDRQIKELESAQNTVGNNKKYDALTAQLEELKANSQRDQLKAQLSGEVFGKAQNTRLAESYNERARRGQTFEADISKYNAKQQKVIKKAVDSGILNNTRRTHEFVDMIAKISADKGVSFDFTDNERLKTSGFAVDGAVVNGYVNDAGDITLNINSSKATRAVVGHEVTHILEGTALYEELQNVIEEYAQSRGEYESRLEALTKLYKGKKGYETDFDAKVRAELTADLVGDYLFDDADFINNLSTKHRNVFQKIYDEIKYLCKVATAGSAEARELEKVKKAFEDAYRADGKASGDTKYSLGYHAGDLGKAELLHQQGYSRGTGHFGTGTYFVGDEAKISGHTYGARPHHAVEFDNYNLYKVRNDDDGYALHDQLKVIDGGISQEYYDRAVADEYSLYPYVNAFELAEKYEAEGNSWEEAEALAYQEIAEMRGIEYKSAEEYGKENDFTVDDEDFYFYYNDYLKETVDKATEEAQSDYAQFRDAYFKLWLRFGKDNTNKALQGVIAHQQKINPDGQRDYWREHAAKADSFATVFMKSLGYEGIDTRGTGLDNVEYGSVIYDLKGEDLAKKNAIGTAKYSLTDNTGKELSKGQQDYFKDSKVRDDDGNLRVLYHGTPNQFTTFRQSKADGWGTGIYFTDNRVAAEDYGENIVEAYVNITNPYNADTMSYYDIGAEETKAYQDFDRRVWQERFDEYDTYEEYKADGMGVDMYEIYTEEVEVFNQILRELGYDGIIADGSNSIDGLEVVAFNANQPKLTTNTAPTADADIRNSLSYEGETHRYRGDAPMSELALDVAPVQDSVQDSVQDIAPTKPLSADDMISALWDAEFKMQGYDPDAEMDASEEAARDAFKRIRDTDAPPEMEAPYYGESEPATADDPLADRDWVSVGDRKVKAFMYENPEVKPFFQAEAEAMLGDLFNTIKGERHYNDELYYNTNGEKGWYGTKRQTADDIAYLLDGGISYAQLERGLNAIIEGNGAENNAVSKRIELAISDRLRNGYTDFMTGVEIPPNQEYIEWLNERQHNAEYAESIDSLMADAPISEEIAPVMDAPMVESQTVEDVMPIADAPIAYEAIRPKAEKEPRMARATPTEQARAQVLTEEPKAAKKKNGLWSKVKNDVLDKGMVFEDLSLKTGNRELQAKWNSIRYADGKAQKQIGESLKPIREAVEKTGKTQQFYEYLYHMHNVDRMTLAERFPDMENKPVFGDIVTARESRAIIAELVRKNPEFKQYAQDVYEYNTNLRELLVEGGVISRETANLWEKMYPHYVPIRRDGDTGLNINVPLDTGRTGVNAPIKRATGGSRDILPLFDTMGQRTMQTYKAIAKNRFGVELKNTLGTTIESDALGVDEAIDSIDGQDGLLQEGKNGKNATFTVFENGEKVTFEITDEMYDAMKPTSEGLATTIKPLNVASNIFRGLTTEYNPTFIFTNPIKDVQDVLINSQHPARTYFAIPKAIKEMATNGHWYQEYVSNGGEQNTYFDKQTNTFAKEKSGIGKLLGLPLDGISKANNFIEMMPRLAEYIVSRQMNRSIDVSMLDAARVTTNFAAGGDLTKWANRNGATFLNASVQGAVQQVRNVREAKADGLKGVLTLAAKFGVAGLSAALLNGLLWKDDEEYEELSDYVKQNYYIVGKFGDGQFVRIPKGRTVAVIQDAFEQMQHLITGDDEADLKAFGELLIGNLAPNNPLENNIFAPIMQVANNKTWYGEDLVPTRLQDVPANEQYDESTDSISRWLGEKLDVSPYKINYLLNQYGGGVADTFLPMLTPEAESGDDSLGGNLLAPFKSKFTTDSVMNNQTVADFYDTVDELTVNANSSKATDRDALKYKYINSVNADMGELYKQKREIQNSNLPDAEKYEAVREIQQQIDEMAKDALATYKNVSITGNYATVGDRQYRWYEPSEDSDAEAGWQKLTDKQVAKQDKVTSGLGITPSEYWDNKEEYDYAYDNPEKYAVAKSVGGYQAYRGYSSELYDIKADKDSSGKSISGSRKDKVIDYVNGLDIDYGMRIILFKSEYTADDTYNNDIIDYLNDRDDISYDEMVTILKELDFTVSSDGSISW